MFYKVFGGKSLKVMQLRRQVGKYTCTVVWMEDFGCKRGVEEGDGVMFCVIVDFCINVNVKQINFSLRYCVFLLEY